MKTIKTVIYKCEHCGKVYQRKIYCLKHEGICRKNPANQRPCFGCYELEMKEIEYGNYDPNEGEPPYHGNALFCNRKKCFVYPPYVKKPYHEEDLDYPNIPMPTICNIFNDMAEESR